MEEKSIMVEQYKIYLEMKEKFTDRNFSTNKFFILMLTVVLGMTFAFKNVAFPFHMSANLFLSTIGILMSILYTANVDAYNVLIKIKLSDMAQKMEEMLPIKIQEDEMAAINKWKGEKKGNYLFSDIQKLLGHLYLIIFVVLFFIEAVPFIYYNVRGL
ncbi:MAG: hypothetical protein PHV68_05000 [Candidatus Gastranaerophilales bacterium]|nr:hypothetical protein [Candidatus Gastranaerophilales bacterium]